jgi:YVTN family beta-propeller protein
LANDSVSIIDVKSDRVIGRVFVGHQPFTLAPSPDHKRLFIAQQGGGVGLIDTTTRSFQLASDLKEPVFDLVTTPDGKAAYLALGFLGLAKLDIATRSVNIISRTGYVRGASANAGRPATVRVLSGERAGWLVWP